jgi:hypothetical protein
MNEQERQLADIQRDEAWLAGFSTPQPEPIVMERIKYLVRQACGEELAWPGGETAKALANTKAAVRRELTASAAAPAPMVFRPWAPVLVAAASVAFAFVTLWSGGGSDTIGDPDLAAFVAVMARPDDEIALTLLKLEDDITLLASGSDSAEWEAWPEPSPFEFDDAAEPSVNNGNRSEDNS